ncbi:hypothetical protein [uncultured Nostoc sp.]|uniref:hypothetical protein n=1 Tax=uncultured Nostoc sp. TaxID=340711 RepID=UPI0035CBF90B
MVNYDTLGAKNGMENQELKKAPEITVESDRSPGTDRGTDIKSDASSHQNIEVENKAIKKAPKITVESDRSPGTDRGL